MTSRKNKSRLVATSIAIAAFWASEASAVCTTQGLELMRNLNGGWRGKGAITPRGASPEFISCRVSYSMTGEAIIHQQIACAGTDYKMEAASDVTCEGNLLEGTFKENVTNSSGRVSGSISGNHLTIEADGSGFKGMFQVLFRSASNHLVSITQFDQQADRQMPLASIQLTREFSPACPPLACLPDADLLFLDHDHAFAE
jgi:hypothetical protein